MESASARSEHEANMHRAHAWAGKVLPILSGGGRAFLVSGARYGVRSDRLGATPRNGRLARHSSEFLRQGTRG